MSFVVATAGGGIDSMKLNMNTKVIIWAGVGAAGALLLLPSLFLRALPLLLLAACPLAMIFMMRGMGGMAARRGDPGRGSTERTDGPTPAPQDEAVRLRAEVGRLRAQKAVRETGTGATAEEHTRTDGS